MAMTETPLACDLTAIPPDERANHVAAARRLFKAAERIDPVAHAGEEGWRVRFDAGAFDDVARWITWERLCCPSLRNASEVVPRGGAITLATTGPTGTIAFLEQEIR